MDKFNEKSGQESWLKKEDWLMVSDVNYFWVLFIPILFVVSDIMPALIERCCRVFSPPSQKEKNLQKEIHSIKEEMRNLSMVDEFAKYSKLKRKLIQLNLAYDSDVGARQAVHQKLTRISKYVSYVIMGLIYIVTLFYSGHTKPVCIVPINWFYPLNYIFSYPTGIEGAISIPIWTVLTRSTMAALTKM